MINFFPFDSYTTPVLIYDSETKQIIFESADVMKVVAKMQKTPTKYHTESGAVRSDHVIDNQTELQIDLILSGDRAKQMFSEIEAHFAGKLLVDVQTRMRTYEGMLISSLGDDEESRMLNGAAIPISLLEWRETKPEYGELRQADVKDKKNADTVSRGKQKGATPPPEVERKGSVMSRWGLI